MAVKKMQRLSDAMATKSKVAEQEYSIGDTSLKGFALRVHPTGSKSWTLRRRDIDNGRRITLGETLSMTVDEARTAVYSILSGSNPAASSGRGLLFSQFEKIYGERRTPHWKASTLRTYRSRIRSRILPSLGAMRLAGITHADVARVFYNWSADFPGGANRTLAILKDMFSRAADWGLLPAGRTNPCGGIKLNRRPRRGRLLTEECLARLGRTLQDRSNTLPDVVDLIEVLLLTGCRFGEIAGLRWTDAQEDRLLLPDSKTGSRTVLLGAPAMMILNRRRCASAKNSFVFPSPRNPNCPRTDISWSWRSIRTEAKLPSDIRIHDLRHAFASHAVMNGETLLMAGSMLGHRRPETTARYAHLEDTHLASAAERVASLVSEWMSSHL